MQTKFNHRNSRLQQVIVYPILIVILLCFSPVSVLSSSETYLEKDAWYDGEVEHPVWRIADQYVELEPSIPISDGTAGFNGRAYKVEPLPENIAPDQLPARRKNQLSPVYTISPDPRAPKMILTGDVIVHFPVGWTAQQVADFMSAFKTGPGMKFPFGKNIYSFPSHAISDALVLANTIYKSGKVEAAYPDWMILEPLKELQ